MRKLHDTIPILSPYTSASNVTVVTIYTPINPSSGTTQAAATSDTFYDQLQSVVSVVPPRNMLSVLVPVPGDFNAHVGCDFQSWRFVVGPHGMCDCNGNGEKLLDFCSNNQLLVTNTWFSTSPSTKPLGSKMEIVQGLIISSITF